MGKTDTGVQVRKHKNCSNLFMLARVALRTLDERYIIRHIVTQDNKTNYHLKNRLNVSVASSS